MEILAILKMLAVSTAQLGPGVMLVVGTIKRFISNEKRDVANPVLAVITGLLGAYMYGGQEEVLAILLQGLLAGGAAIGAYSIPKAIGVRMGVK